MKKEVGKKMILQLVGFFMAGISYFGYYPLGLSFFTAAYKEKVMRLLLFPVMFIGMSLFMEPIQLAKYGLCMIVAATVTSILELDKENKFARLGSASAGISAAAMTYVDYVLNRGEIYQVYMGLGEGVLVFTLSEVMAWGIRYILKEQKAEPVVEMSEVFDYRYKEREKMEGIAKAFKSLASTFTTLSESTAVSMNHVFSDGMAGGMLMSSPADFAVMQKMNTMWHNKLCENRLAIAGQLNEMAHILSGVAKDAYEIQEGSVSLEERISKELKSMHIRVQGIDIIERPDKGMEVYASICSKRNRCIMTKDVAAAVSKVCGKKMIASRDSKVVVYKDFSPVMLVEDVNFKVLYGVSRRVKTGERISGDNFAFIEGNDNKSVIALSDGMGSGLLACQESEMVIELIEQFMEAGFCKETAARMINSSMVTTSGSQLYSTIDISEIDLRSGICEFLKVGAATTFIKRGSWVETIQSTSLPAGMFEQADFDTTAKKLYDGDYIIMISDGTMDCIAGEGKENQLKNIILNTKVENPRDMAEYIMEEIVSKSDGYIPDDMTILVTGMWKK
ncbi:MAG: SpoIIE family protein phosphatase [Lachnospiraceae bacterium]|nr:SpoIIE family protein phosphatase [Lachnospiraceae bacterium]